MSKFTKNIGDALYLNTDADIIFLKQIGIGTDKPQQFVHIHSNVYIKDNVGIGTLTPDGALHVSGDVRMDAALRVTAGDTTLLGNVGIGTASPVSKVQIANGVLTTEHIVPSTSGYDLGSNATAGRFHRAYVSEEGVDMGGWRFMANKTADYIEARDSNAMLTRIMAKQMFANESIGIGTTVVNPKIGLAVHGGSVYVRGNIGIGTVLPTADLHIQSIKGWNVTQELFNDAYLLGDAVTVSENGECLAIVTSDMASILIYTWTTNGWIYSTRIAPELVSAPSWFGYSIDMNSIGTRLVVGAPLEQGSGRVYVFHKTGLATWNTVSVLAPTGSSTSSFGRKVSIDNSGAYIAVGSPTEDVTGVVYVYWYNATSLAWEQQARIVAPLTTPATVEFGKTVKLDAMGSHMFIGRQSPESVVVADRIGTNWALALNNLIVAPDADATIFGFGTAIEVSSDNSVLVVGAPIQNSAAGALYIYKRASAIDANYVFSQKITAVGAGVNHRLGDFLDVNADGRVIVANEYLFKFNDVLQTWNEFHIFTQNHPHVTNTSVSITDDGHQVFLSSPLEDRVYVFTELLEPYINIQSFQNDDIFIVSHDGNLGIGTAVPLRGLHVQKEAYIAQSLGIGTLSPSAPLHVVGGAHVETRLTLDGDAILLGNVGIGTLAAASMLHVVGGDATITGGGAIGVGTTRPAYPLHIVTSNLTAQALAVSVNDIFTVSAAGKITAPDSFVTNMSACNMSLSIGTISDVTIGGSLTFNATAKVTSEVSVTSNVYADGNISTLLGNIGIGTQTPSSFLDLRAHKHMVSSSNLSSHAVSAVSLATSDDGAWLLVSDPIAMPNLVINEGIVHAYHRVDDIWTYHGLIINTTPSVDARFGSSMCFSSDASTAFIGMLNSVAVFMLQSNTWTRTQTLTEPGVGFGKYVAFSKVDSRLLVGATSKDETGAVYVFGKTGETWVYESLISPNAGVILEEFGAAIQHSSDGHVRLIGAPNRVVNGIIGAGAVYKYRWNTTSVTWVFDALLTADVSYTNARLGSSLDAMNDGTVVASAIGTQTVHVFHETSHAHLQKITGSIVRTFLNKYLIIGSPALQKVQIYDKAYGKYKEYQSVSGGYGYGSVLAMTGSNSSQLFVADSGTQVNLLDFLYDRPFMSIYDEANADVFTVANTGKVGIHTSNPQVGLEIRGTDAILLPRGTSSDRPVLIERGYIRYNTETNQFEGLGAANQWGSLGGVKSTDQFTFISAEESAGANDSNLRFVTGGTQRMIIDSTGNIGVGTTTPRALTDIVGGGAGSGDILRVNDGFVIDSYGNVGIGTLTPLSMLHIGGEGDVRIDRNIGIGTAVAAAKLHVLGTGDVLRADMAGSGAPTFIVSNGNVGMGTALPLYKVHVEGNTFVNGTTLTSNLVVYDSIQFTNKTQSTNFKRHQVVPIKANIWVDDDVLNALPIVLTTPGFFTATPLEVDVVRNGNKQYYLNENTHDYDIGVGYDFSASNTSFTMTFTDELAIGDMVNITIWPNYIDNHWAYNIQNITLFTMANVAAIDRVFGAALQGSPFHYVHKEIDGGTTLFEYSVNGQYAFDAFHTHVYRNGTKLTYMQNSLAANPVQEYGVSVIYGLYSTTITLVLANALVVGDTLDISFWPVPDPSQSNVFDGVVVQNFQNQVVFNGTEGSSPVWYLNGNIGIGTNLPRVQLDVRGDVDISNSLHVDGNTVLNSNVYVGATLTTDDTVILGGTVTVSGHVVPSSNIQYDLGSASSRWRDLYLSGNTIDLGGTFLKRNEEGGGIKVTSDSGEDVDTSSRNVNASGYVNVNGTVLRRHITGPLMVTKHNGDMESGMFKHVYVDGTIRASNLEIIGDYVTLNTVTSNTEQIVVINDGTGPALKVTQTGANSIAEFYDDGDVLALKIADGGNVGIGTHIPTQRLHVNGAIKATTSINCDTQFLGQASDSSGAPPFSFIDDTNTGIYHPAADNLGFSCGGTEHVRVLSNGNVGIGTAIPDQKLFVVGGIKSTTSINCDVQFLGQASDSATVPPFSFIDDTNTGIYHPAADTLAVSTGGSEKMRVIANGNVGIGSGNPLGKLDVAGSVIATSIQIGTVTNAHVPRGVIVMWSGSTATIPTGWTLCDGANTTPDLRNRFIIGAGSSYAVAATGGATTVTLGVANLPAHTHTGTTDNHTHSHSVYDPGHSHRQYVTFNGGGGGVRRDYAGDVQCNQFDQGINGGGSGTGIGIYDNTHAHTFTTSGTTSASSSAFGILPPYYALAFIMKL